MNRQEFVNTLSSLRPSSTFLVLHRYRNNQGELSDFNILFHISYENALKKSQRIIEAVKPENDLEKQAKEEILESIDKSLLKIATVQVDEIDDAYQRFFDGAGNYIKGVKLHREHATLQIYGFAHMKRVIEPGSYKQVNHRPLTIAKKKLLKDCPHDKFRQFVISPDKVERIVVEKLELLPPEDVNL